VILSPSMFMQNVLGHATSIKTDNYVWTISLFSAKPICVWYLPRGFVFRRSQRSLDNPRWFIGILPLAGRLYHFQHIFLQEESHHILTCGNMERRSIRKQLILG
jgi:hypothetical protein